MSNKIVAYKDLLKVVKKHEELFDRESPTLSSANLKGIVEALGVAEEFNLPLQGLQSGTFLRIQGVYDEWTNLSFYGEKEGRTIGCPDGGVQPENEWLFVIRFTCGAYSLGGDRYERQYPRNTFDNMFDELKSYGAAFVDSANDSLYFRADKARAVYDAFWPTFKNYKGLVDAELKEQRKQELIKELESLGEK